MRGFPDIVAAAAVRERERYGELFDLAPFIVEEVAVGIFRVEFDFVDIRRVGAAGGHRPGDVFVMTESDIGRPRQAHAAAAQFTGVNAHFPEAADAEPGQMRIDQQDGVAAFRARRADRPLIRGARRDDKVRIDAAAPQVAHRLVDRPVVEKHAAEGVDHLRRDGGMIPPWRHVVGIRAIKVGDAVGERDEAVAFGFRHVGDRQPGIAHVSEHVRDQRRLHAALAGDFGQLAEGDLQIHEQLRGPILGLGPALGVKAGFDRRRINMRHAETVAIDHGPARVLALPRQRRGCGLRALGRVL